MQPTGLCPIPKLNWPLTLKGQGRHTLGDKWSTSPIVQRVSLSIYWLPKWSIMRWFMRDTAIPPGSSEAGLSLSAPFRRHLFASIWFIREWTEAGLHHLQCLFKANRRLEWPLWTHNVTSEILDKRYEWTSAGITCYYYRNVPTYAIYISVRVS